MQVINPALRAERTSVPAVRTVTVLGATGSVGLSTVDLLKRGNGQYRVALFARESLTTTYAYSK